MGFAIKSRIGRGRTVETFAATLEVGGEALDVAVKRPRAELSENQAFIAAFLRWGEEEKEFEHDDIIGVLETGRTAEGAYVIQERVRGASLAEVLQVLRRQKRTFSLSMAMTIAETVATGLAALHERGVAHGGLDPREVLLAYDGSVKLGDQRLRALDTHASGAPTSADEAAVHRAPELDSGAAPASPASDVYALALIVLEMLIGHAVWRSPSMTVEASILALKDFTHVGLAAPGVTEELVDILYGSTLPKPEDRVPSGKELRAGIARVIQKFALRTEPHVLGAFVETAVPAELAEETPTQLVAPGAGAAPSPPRASREGNGVPRSFPEELVGASVPIDPDLERKALSRVAPAPSRPRAEVGAFAGAAPAVGSLPSDLEGRLRLLAAAVRASFARMRLASPLGFASGGAGGPASATPLSRAFARARPARLIADASDLVRIFRMADWQTRAGVGVIALILTTMAFHMLTRGDPNPHVLRMRASSEPEGAQLFVDGELIGTTPLETTYPARRGRVRMRFVLDGHKAYDVSIETAEDELRYEAKLRKEGAD